jgi:enterochelin esterase-like enzyme
MNRSFEYDSVSGDYARFLLEEMLPHISKTHGLNLSNDPNARAKVKAIVSWRPPIKPAPRRL